MQGQKEFPLLPVQKAEQEVLTRMIPVLISDQDLSVELVTGSEMLHQKRQNWRVQLMKKSRVC